MEAKAFYAVICVATIVGIIMNFTPVDPIRALYWSAVINGVVADFVVTGWAKILGWIATAVMLVAIVAMLTIS